MLVAQSLDRTTFPQCSRLPARRAVRYELHIPVAFFRENAEGSTIQSEGIATSAFMFLLTSVRR